MNRPRVALLAASLFLTGCVGGAVASPGHPAGAAPARKTPPDVRPLASPAPEMSVQAAPLHLPGLGPRTLAAIPADARQAVVVTGHGRNSPQSTVVLYE